MTEHECVHGVTCSYEEPSFDDNRYIYLPDSAAEWLTCSWCNQSIGDNLERRSSHQEWIDEIRKHINCTKTRCTCGGYPHEPLCGELQDYPDHHG